jgi:hypothetical protein
MTLTGAILQIPREKEKTYLYMPNPSLVHSKSVKINHHLKVADVFITFGCPETFLLEPVLGHYRPDAYMIVEDVHSCIEVQITPISKKKMQEKVDNFVATSGIDHSAKTLYLFSDYRYDALKVPDGFEVLRYPLPKEVYS